MRYVHDRLTIFDEIWYGYVHWPSQAEIEIFMSNMTNGRHFENRKIATPPQRYDRFWRHFLPTDFNLDHLANLPEGLYILLMFFFFIFYFYFFSGWLSNTYISEANGPIFTKISRNGRRV